MSNESLEQVLSRLLTRTTDEVYCSCPCQVLRVNGNYVDVLAIINDDEPDFPLYHVPIKRMETQNAYVFLKISEGDYGTLTFFDRDTTDYIATGNTEYNYNDEQHSINFRAFELGFVPDPSAFVYPIDKEIEIGLKGGQAKINIDTSGNITIYSVDNITLKSGVGVVIDAPDTTTIGNLSAGNGKSGMYATNSGILTFTNGILTAST